MTTTTLYDELKKPFDHTYTRTVAGVELTYVTGEQVVSRLNEVLDYQNWSFRVLEHGILEDEVWVKGELIVHDPLGRPDIIRSQFGSQKIKRSRASGTPVDIGFDLKGAATDALKKCASLIGVGLYLSEKEQQRHEAADDGDGDSRVPLYDARPGGPGSRPATQPPLKVETSTSPYMLCVDCAQPLEEITFKDGKTWTIADLARYGRAKWGRVLCMNCYKAAKNAAQ